MKKALVMVLAVTLVILAALYVQGLRVTHNVREQLNSTSNELSSVVSKFVTTQVEVVQVRTQLVEQVARAVELEQRIVTEKAKADEQIATAQKQAEALRKDLEVARKEAEEEAKKIEALEGERTKLATQLGSITGKLADVSKKLAALQISNTATIAELKEAQQIKIQLEMEKASLERQLNDLDTLRSQIRLVKQRLRDQKIADWERRDKESGANGNRGFIMQEGQWKNTAVPGANPPAK